MCFPTLPGCGAEPFDGPFPWGVVDDFAADTTYARIASTFVDPVGRPEADVLGKGKVRVLFRAPPVPALVSEIGEPWVSVITELSSYEYVTRTWEWARKALAEFDTADGDYGTLRRARDLLKPQDLAWQFEFSSMSSGSWLPPHTDSVDKILSCVLYLPQEDWDSNWGGETLIQRPRAGLPTNNWGNRIAEQDEVETLNQIAFTKNRLFWFLKTPASWHAVSPVTAPTGFQRRSFNFSLVIRPEVLHRPSIAVPTARILECERESGG